LRPVDPIDPINSNKTADGTKLRDSPNYKVVYWRDRNGVRKPFIFDLSKGEYTNKWKAWVQNNADNAFAKDVYGDKTQRDKAIDTEMKRIKTQGFRAKPWIELPPVNLGDTSLKSSKLPAEKPILQPKTDDSDILGLAKKYADEQPNVPEKKSTSIKGTTWKEDNGSEYHFNADGTFYRLTSSGKRTPSGSDEEFTWQQSGERVTTHIVTHGGIDYGSDWTGTVGGESLSFSTRNFGYNQDQYKFVLTRVRP
jgi:hypothetical protein